jgi:hypothetical protein
MTDIIRALRLYFNQLDSLTPNQAQSYRADNFYGGDFDGTVMTANNVATSTLTATYSNVSSMMSEFIRSKGFLGGNFVGGTFMGTNFYGNSFIGQGKGLSFPYGAFQSDQNQTTTNNTVTQITLNVTDYNNNITNSSGNMTVNTAGLYNLQFSIQFINTDNSAHESVVWLRKNNTNVPGTASRFDTPARKSAGVFSYVIGACNFYINAAVGDVIKLYWATNQAYQVSPSVDGVYLYAEAANTTPPDPYPHPAIPSVVVTLTYVSSLTTAGDANSFEEVAPISVTGFGQIGTVIVNTTNTI